MALKATKADVWVVTLEDRPGSAAGKLEALRRYPSVALELYSPDSDETEMHARKVAEESGLVYISPYNDRDVIAGQGTIGVELSRQCPDLDAVFIAVGEVPVTAMIDGRSRFPDARYVAVGHPPADPTVLEVDGAPTDATRTAIRALVSEAA